MSEDKPESFPIDNIHVPVKKKKELKPEVVQEIATSMLEIGQQTPILVRTDGDHLVLVEGLHRLEACKALGESNILGVLVSAEFAHHRAALIDSAEVEAERDKMARLKRLRLEKEAAEKSAAISKPVIKAESAGPLRERSGKKVPSRSKASSQSNGKTHGKTQESRAKTLSDWIAQQKRDGGRY